ncbi:hypothetical protein [uncultured Desulfuromonas sp.]|uniref:hypothetical protein n=1 Tax=uncultured Desulfuromonas sp. TaxID=181013 RepID=UPI002AAB341D|nr:hypothetical protein [uncultured Desulfuromonas sp.]
MTSDIRGDVGIKIYSEYFETFVELGEQVEHVMTTIPGATDVAVEQITANPPCRLR